MKKVFLAIIVFFYVTSFAEEYPVEDEKARILILYNETETKKFLVSKIIDDLNSRQIGIMTDMLHNEKKYSADNFDAVVLLSEVNKFSPNKDAADFIKRNNYHKKIVYVSTYIKFNNPYGLMNVSLNKSKIDVISAASPDKGEQIDYEKIEKIYFEIIEKVNKVIN